MERTLNGLGAGMQIFISWSGPRSKHVALAFKEWLPMVLHYAQPWVSDADIEAGERWASAVAGHLEESNFGIVCVTPSNVNSPWVLFESGALAKSLEVARVIPVLLDLDFSDLVGPLAQFQAKKLDRDGVSDIVSGIQLAADDPIPDDRARQLTEALFPRFLELLGGMPDRPDSQRASRPQSEILEELVTSMRSLDQRFSESQDILMFRARDEFARSSGSSARRVAPGFLSTVLKESDGPDDPTALLVGAGMLRNEMPWLYEQASALVSSPSREKPRAYRRLRRSMQIAERLANDEGNRYAWEVLHQLDSWLSHNELFLLDPEIVQAED